MGTRPGIPATEAALGAVYLLYPVAAALENPTYHLCKARLLDLQDKIKLSTTTPHPFQFREVKQNTKGRLYLNYSCSGQQGWP